MNSQKISKINNLLKNWPKGTVATYVWLESQGVYRQLADTYMKGSWLERVGRGAFKRASEKVDWTGALYAMQTQLNLSVHVAGKTALQMQGYAHYVSLGSESAVDFLGNQNEKLPAWFQQYKWKTKIRYTMSNLFGDERMLGLTEHKAGDYSIKISAPERALFEVCYDVPDKESFEEAGYLMEGLTTLRPNLVQELLEKCRSVKTKRIFMYLAEEQNHAWLKKLNLAKVDFGKGKRSLCLAGQYNKKYQLVVPRKDIAV